MTLAEDLRSELLDDADVTASVGSRVHYQHVPQGYLGPYIWFARAGSSDDDDRALGDASGQTYHFRELFDVEAISASLSESQNLAGYLKKFDNFRNEFGDGSVQAVFVRDHAEDYVPRGVMGDDGYFVGALQFEIIGYIP